MQTFTDTLDSLWQVLLIGLAFGAGLPILFAYGIRFLSPEDVGTDGAAAKRGTFGTIAGTICMAIVVAAVVTGILFVMSDFLATDLGIHLF